MCESVKVKSHPPPSGSHLLHQWKARSTLTTSAGCTTRPHTHLHAHAFTQSHITHTQEGENWYLFDPISDIFHSSRSELWPPVEWQRHWPFVLFDKVADWGSALSPPHKQITCHPQCSTPACHNRLFYCIVTFQGPPPSSWQREKLTVAVFLRSSARTGNRLNCSDNSWSFEFLFEIWIERLKYRWAPKQARLINMDNSSNGKEGKHEKTVLILSYLDSRVAAQFSSHREVCCLT